MVKFMFKIKSMNKNLKSIFVLAFVLSIGQNMWAQSTFSATSHSATIQGVTYEYVIGEMTLVTTEKNPNLIVTQGFLQPQNVEAPAGVDDQNLAQFLQVYPNPTDDVVFIDIKQDVLTNLTYNLFDASGRVLLTGKADGKNLLTVNVKSYATGNYYLLLTSNHTGKPENYSFKIQKK